MFWLESDFINLVVLDKELLFQNSSSSCAFEFSKQFKKFTIIPNNRLWGSKQAICDESIGEIFNEYFPSVFRKPLSDYSVPTVSPASDVKLSEVDVSPSVVNSCFQSVKNNTCTVDCIPAFIYNFPPLLVFFFTLLSTIASGLLPGNVLLLPRF